MYTEFWEPRRQLWCLISSDSNRNALARPCILRCCHICFPLQILAHNTGASIHERRSLALICNCGCGRVRRCVVQATSLYVSFGMRSNGWPAVRWNLGSVDVSKRCGNFGLCRLCESSEIFLAGDSVADVRDHSRRSLLRVLCKASCKRPVTRCRDHPVKLPGRKSTSAIMPFPRSYRLIPCENQMNSIRNEPASRGHRIFLVAVRLTIRPNNER